LDCRAIGLRFGEAVSRVEWDGFGGPPPSGGVGGRGGDSVGAARSNTSQGTGRASAVAVVDSEIRDLDQKPGIVIWVSRNYLHATYMISFEAHHQVYPAHSISSPQHGSRRAQPNADCDSTFAVAIS
jgi:hypothetical protein